MHGWKSTLLALGLIGAATGQTLAADRCPGNPNAMGTSRTIVVDPTEHPRIGSMQYSESLPLEDHEVVLTFDDGPLPGKSKRVLDLLASECIKATFFLIGRMAHTFPDTVREIRDAGHTIGTHSQDHPLSFNRMPLERAEQQINDGIANVTAALGGTPPSPFFRIPGLLRIERVENYLADRHIMVWSADFPADDWHKITPAQVYDRAIQRIEAHHKGILLLHDIQERTVEALPNILRELKARGYRIVHVVAANPETAKTPTEPRQWLVNAHSARHPAVAVGPAEADLEFPAPSPASFGATTQSGLRSILYVTSPRGAGGVTEGGRITLRWQHDLDQPPPFGPIPARNALPVPSFSNLGITKAEVVNPSDPLAVLRPRENSGRTVMAAALNAAPAVALPFDVVPRTSGPAKNFRLMVNDQSGADPAISGAARAAEPFATARMPQAAFP